MKILLKVLVVCALFFGHFNANATSKEDYLGKFFADVKKSVANTHELSKSKSQIFAVIQALQKNGVYTQSGNDEKKRAVLVGLQSAVEHVLNQRKQSNPEMELLLVYHTPTPTTALCTLADPISEGVIAAKIKNSKEVQYTVSSRAKIVRDLLRNGAKTYVVFQKGGLSQRTKEQQKIYKSELAKHRVSLKSRELDVSKMSGEMIGATHLFENEKGEPFVFFIQATQVNNPSNNRWQIGLGSLKNAAIKRRVDAVLGYLSASGESEVKIAFEKEMR